MSIFKESLPNYIKDQLNIREGAVRMGQGEASKGRMAEGITHTSMGNVVIDKGAFFTNTINKSCTIRMASLVDLQTDTVLEKDGVNGRIEKDFGGPGMALTYILEGGTIIKGVKDNKMTVNDVGDAVRSLKINEKPVMRRGFPTQKWNLGGTYGDPIIRADAKDGYGIVPMPGITSIDIKTKSAYGSLREAKVKFECHNLRQLEILELLYMRPGYPILLEWGWNTFVNNKGKITNAPSWISENPDFWNAEKVSQEALASQIIKKRKDTGGNYDGLLGFCKNFSYTARPDGGFSCSTELMAVGECINSIKGNMVTTKNKEDEKFDMPKIQHLLNHFVDGIIGLVGGDSTTTSGIKNYEDPGTQEDYINKLANMIDGTTGNSGEAKSIIEGNSTDDLKDLKELFNIKKSQENITSTSIVLFQSVPNQGGDYVIDKMREEGYWQQTLPINQKLHQKISLSGNITNVGLAEYEEKFNEVVNTWKQVAKSTMGENDKASTEDKEKVENWQKSRDFNWDEALAGIAKEIEKSNKVAINSDAYKDILQPGIHLIGPQHDSTNKDRLKGKMGFIRLDSFCKLLNRLVIPENTKSQNQNSRIMAFQTNHLSTHGGKSAVPYFDTYKFNAYNEKFFDLFAHHVDLDISVDPFICLFPHQVVNMEDNAYSEEIEFYRPVKDVSGYQMKDEISDREFWGYRFPHKKTDINHDVRERAKRSVGHIYLNLDMLHKQCKKLQTATKNEHFSLGKFMFNVLEEVNKATGGNHKLAMVNNHEFPNIINIVDINGESAHKSYNDIHKINVQSTDSVVRKFSFNTEIPSAMSATIAVAAQNPNDANALDEVTFAALNRGIRNRLYRPSGPNSEKYSKKEKEKKKELLNKQIEELGHKLASIKYYNKAIKSRIQQKDDDQRSERTNNYRSTLIRVQTLTDILSQKDDNGLPRYLDDKTHGPPSSTPIPIKVDLEFDGIGGLVIGQLFRINTNRLPKHYRDQNIIFIIKSEQQKIGNNGDWTTKISGQMQLFEVKPKRSKYGDRMKRYLDKAVSKRGEEERAMENELNNAKKEEEIDRTISKEDQESAEQHKKNYEALVYSRKWYVTYACCAMRAHRVTWGDCAASSAGAIREWDNDTIIYFTKMGDHTMLNVSEAQSIYTWMIGGYASSEYANWHISHGGNGVQNFEYYENKGLSTWTEELEAGIGSEDVPRAKRALKANEQAVRLKRRSQYGHESIPNNKYGPKVKGSDYKPIDKYKSQYVPDSIEHILENAFPYGKMANSLFHAGEYEPNSLPPHLSSWGASYLPPNGVDWCYNNYYSTGGSWEGMSTFGGSY